MNASQLVFCLGGDPRFQNISGVDDADRTALTRLGHGGGAPDPPARQAKQCHIGEPIEAATPQ